MDREKEGLFCLILFSGSCVKTKACESRIKIRMQSFLALSPPDIFSVLMN